MSRWEYSLRTAGGGRTVLMERFRNPTTSKWTYWADVATFTDYNDADRILRLVRQGALKDEHSSLRAGDQALDGDESVGA